MDTLPAMAGAVSVTLSVMGWTLLFGCILGLLMAAAKIKGGPALKKAMRIITDIVRGLPTMLILFLVYFGLFRLISSVTGFQFGSWDKRVFVITALSMELAVQCSEMFCSAYKAIDRTQIEAAVSLGYTQRQCLSYIYLPQGFRIILPNIGNTVLAVMQSTALVYTLGVFDILGKARQIAANNLNMQTFEMFTLAAVLYWLIAIVNDLIFRWLEKKVNHGLKW